MDSKLIGSDALIVYEALSTAKVLKRVGGNLAAIVPSADGYVKVFESGEKCDFGEGDY